MGKQKELLFNTIIIGIGKFGTQVLSFFLLPLYTSALSTEQYGKYDLIITVSLFLLPVITLLMEESMFRFLIDCKDDKEKRTVVSQVLKYIFKKTIVFTFIMLTIAIVFKSFDVCITLLYIIALIILASTNAVMRGLGKIKEFSIANFFNGISIVILNVFFILKLKLGYHSLLYSVIIVDIMISAIVVIKLKLYKYIDFKSKKSNQIKKMKKYSIPLVPNSISWAIINVSDRLIISGVLGTAANGVYSMANKFPSIMDSIYGFFYTAWKESAAKALKDENSGVFYNSIYKTLKNLLYTMVLGMLTIMPFVFNILIKSNFNEAYLYIPILVIAMYFSNVSGFYGGIFSAYKDTKIMGSTTIISAVINVVVNIALIYFVGIWAAAISTLCSTFIVYILRKIKLKKIIKLEEDKKITTVFKVVFIALCVSLYYCNCKMYNIVFLVVVLLYCLYVNLDLIKSVTKSLIKPKL